MMGSANAWANGLSGIGNAVSGGANNWMQYSMMNNLMNKQNTLGGMGGSVPGISSMPSAESMQMPQFGSSLGAQPTFSLAGQ